jgi:Tfp pilus assembly protein PilX
MDIRREDGIALMVAMMAMLLMTALGVALVLTTSSETIIAGNYRNSGEALYAADAVLERAIDDLLTVPDWNSLLTGSVQSAFIDGAPSGARSLPDGSTIDLTQALNMANCAKVTTCSTTDMDTVTTERPWGPNNPRWQLYAYGKMSSLMPTDSVDSSYYVIVMVGDDPSETDRNPLQDGITPCLNTVPTSNGASPPVWSCNPGTGVLAMRAEAFGPRGAHKVIELTVARTDTTELERGYTGQRGQDEQNRRARKAAVQTPGKALTMQTLDLNLGGIH